MKIFFHEAAHIKDEILAITKTCPCIIQNYFLALEIINLSFNMHIFHIF